MARRAPRKRRPAATRPRGSHGALSKLNELASRLWRADNLREGLEEMLGASIELLEADMGNIQLLDEARNVLHIAAQRGFGQDFLDFFREVSIDDDSACGRTLRSGCRTVIEDIEKDPPYAPLRAVARAAGYRAVQSTPLVGHDGKPIGMLSTHFRAPHRPRAAQLQQLDMYARLAADFITRSASEEALRRRESELDLIANATPLMLTRCSRDLRYLFVNRAYAAWLGTTPGRIVGRPIVEVMGEAAFSIIKPRIDRVLQREVVEYEAEFPAPAGQGGPQVLHVKYLPDCDDSGAVVGWLATIVDITARKLAERELGQRSRELGALYGLADRLQRAAALDDVYEAGLDSIFSALGCDRASVLLFDDAEVMRFVSWRGLSTAYRRAVEGHSPWRPGEKDAQPLGIDDVELADLDEGLRRVVCAEGIRALAFIPLVADERLIGKFMVYYDRPHAVSRGEFDLALTIGRQIAFAVQRQRAEAERRKLEENLRRLGSIVESSDDAIVGQDMGGTITSWNRGAEALYGYRADEIVGKSISILMPSGQADELSTILERLRRGERIDHYETVRIAKDGRRLDLSLSISPIRNAAGETVGASKIARDIGERKRSLEALRESQTRLKLVADSVPALIGYVDRDLRYRFANARYEEWFGLRVEQIEGMHMRDLLGEEIYRHRLPHIERALKGEAARFEGSTRRNRVGAREVALAYVPHIDAQGRVQGIYVMSFDITERKRAEEALKEADRRKDEFIATLSHELRNPLAPLRNSLHVMQLAGGDGNVTRPLLGMMERQVDHLVRLVDDLLEMSRVNQGTLELRRERIDLSTIVRNAVETSDHLIRKAGHRLDVALPQEPLWLDGDPMRLGQILSNLLNNSARYTPEGGKIAVTGRREGDLAAIVVRDNGSGIAPDMLPRVFDMFSRGARSGGPDDLGLGIGLPLARRLAQMHGGTIEARSEGAGRGAEFIVRLPLAPTQAPSSACGRAPHEPLQQERILVVDDNQDAGDSLGMLLQFLGADVRVVRDGAAALREFGDYRPGVVLLDIGMPDMDGYEVARRIRRLFPDRRTPLVALTGWGQDEDRRRAREAGFEHHLVKPADVNSLQTLLASLRRGAAAQGTA